MAEQHIEGTYPIFNQLLRKFGNIRGGRRQKLVTTEFLFSNAMWTVETIDTMLSETKRKFVGAKKKHNKRPGNQLTAAPAVDFALKSNTVEADGIGGLEGGADDPPIGEEHGEADEEAVDMMEYEEVEEDEGGNL